MLPENTISRLNGGGWLVLPENTISRLNGGGCTESFNITHHCPSNGKETQNNQIEKENGRPKITVIAQPTE